VCLLLRLVQDDEGQACVLLFGGHRGDGVLLSDVWKGTVSWPNITWSLLHDPQTGTGQGGCRILPAARCTYCRQMHLKGL
jgi:hypothetical protein